MDKSLNCLGFCILFISKTAGLGGVSRDTFVYASVKVVNKLSQTDL